MDLPSGGVYPFLTALKWARVPEKLASSGDEYVNIGMNLEPRDQIIIMIGMVNDPPSLGLKAQVFYRLQSLARIKHGDSRIQLSATEAKV